MQRKFIIIFFLIFVLLLFPFIDVDASEISNIDMNIHIDKNGNANVIEIWNAIVTDGTEGYHPYYNIGNAKISNFNVSMDGYEFQIVDNWNINGSFDDKANKAGINYLNDEIDLSFGLTKYGSHTYVLKYRINNFVVKLVDADMVYWTLFPKDFNSNPGSVNIIIDSDVNFDDNLPIWGFGKYGAPTYVKDKKIIMSTNGQRVLSNEYLTLLIKFPLNSFNTSYSINKKFDYYLKKSREGSISYKNKDYSKYLLFIPVIGVLFVVIFLSLRSKTAVGVISYKLANLDFDHKNIIKDNEVMPYRDIPFSGDIFRSFWLIHFYNISGNDENILNAFLLKWINSDKVKLEKSNDKIESIVFYDGNVSSNDLENKLYSFFRIASLDDGNKKDEYKLDISEFEKWCSEKGHLISDWFCDVLEKEMDELIAEKKISIERIPNEQSYSLKYVVDSSLKDDAIIVAGLKKFLEEFTVVNERQPMEVKLFNDYLIYASMFGIADKVASKFKELYPDFVVNTSFDFDNFNFVSNIVNNNINFSFSSLNAGGNVGNSGGFDSMLKDASDYTSGGGGFSSGGGGGGSFGGGGGGGGFR